MMRDSKRTIVARFTGSCLALLLASAVWAESSAPAARGANAGSAQTPKPTTTSTTAKKPATAKAIATSPRVIRAKSGPKLRSTALRATRKPAPARTAAASDSTRVNGAKATAAASRRLEDIHIEGEIPMPQVLFITARDQRRFTDFNAQRYLRTSLEVGEQTVYPTRVGTSDTRRTDKSQEAPR